MKNYLQLFFVGGLTSLLFPPIFFIPIGFITIPYFYYKITYLNFLKPLKVSFFEGLSYGLGLNFFLFFWLKNPFFTDIETKKLFFLSYFFVIYASLFFALFVLSLRFFKNYKIQLVVFPILFVLFEILRSKFLISFPWNLFGYIFANQLYLLKLIKYVGIYGISYLAIIIFHLEVYCLAVLNLVRTYLLAQIQQLIHTLK